MQDTVGAAVGHINLETGANSACRFMMLLTCNQPRQISTQHSLPEIRTKNGRRLPLRPTNSTAAVVHAELSKFAFRHTPNRMFSDHHFITLADKSDEHPRL